MDSLASFGRGYASVHYYFTLLVILIAIGYGIYVIVYKSNNWGWLAVGVGILSYFIAKRHYALLRARPYIAAGEGLGRLI